MGGEVGRGERTDDIGGGLHACLLAYFLVGFSFVVVVAAAAFVVLFLLW